MRKELTGIAAAVALMAGVSQAEAAVIFSDRPTFEATLGDIIIDDYSNPGYSSGDVFDVADADGHSDSSMNSVFGETIYTATGHINNNYILGHPGDTF